MSKIGKQPIALPSGVELKRDDDTIIVKGPKGELSRAIPEDIAVTVAENTVTVAPGERTHPARWGLWRALINNMVVGVSEGFSKTLEFQGVGYKASVKGQDLELSLGYSHPITVPAPEGITFSVEKSSITVTGVDKEMVGHVAAVIRSKREPEPYKGAGIRYAGEIIRRKAGKKAATTA